jgi:hypothetical protein
MILQLFLNHQGPPVEYYMSKGTTTITLQCPHGSPETCHQIKNIVDWSELVLCYGTTMLDHVLPVTAQKTKVITLSVSLIWPIIT